MAFILITVTFFATSAMGQAGDPNPGMNRPVTAQDIDRLRQTIHDETSSSLEGLFGFHTETGDLNNRLDFYRVGGRANLLIGQGGLFYVSGVRTPYSTWDDRYKASGTNISVGAEGQMTEGLSGRVELGGTRFSTGSNTFNGLASARFDSEPLTLRVTGSRTNVEETLLSAAGILPVLGPFGGRIVGQVMDNRFVGEATYQISTKLTAFGSGGFGFRKGKNVPANDFKLVGAGAGYDIIAEADEEKISLLRGIYELNYIGFDDNRLGFGGTSLMDARGVAIAPNRIGADGLSPIPTAARAGVGGYFSPERFLHHVVRGEMRGTLSENFTYRLSGFVGSQFITGSPRDQVGGVSGTLAIRLNERFSIPVTVATDNFGPFRQQSILTRLVAWF